MEWTEEGIVLSARPHGDTSLILQALTAGQGRHAGLVRGGQSVKKRAMFEPGNRLLLTWRARIADHLGAYEAEPVATVSSRYYDDPDRLAALAAAAAVAEKALPEREAHPGAYQGLLAFIDALDHDFWPALYVRWEMGVLAELGFGLDLSCCAATGSNDQLAYVSPRTGRAVSLSAGEPYRDRLLTLPGFLTGTGEVTPRAILDGLALTEHFLNRSVFHLKDEETPGARKRMVDRLTRLAA
ncbi:MAG: DNA repair protein RecO [Alphaproteobacteria bacterium]|nr:DNA repair protein RecO [Alphaproteobacteria bacterium]